MCDQEPWKTRDFVARFFWGACFWELHRQRDVDSLRTHPKEGCPREELGVFGTSASRLRHRSWEGGVWGRRGFGYDSRPEVRRTMVAKKSAGEASLGAADKGIAKILKSEIVYQGPVFGVRRDEVLEPGGLQTTREVITHPGSVVVLPVLQDKRIVLIRQYRHATRQYLWELVAGRMDEGESVKEAAARELLEETGYRAKRLKVFLDVFPTPGFLEERMYILLAEGLTEGEAEPEEDEKIEVRAYKLKELKQMIRTGKLRDAKSIAGILYYLTFIRKA
jgi:ADP-ribose pyrophosphatase